ncbi:ABC transporter substrate-binding protein [Phreatobacter aquaticus]|uniref:ABC transporter substrate-binding protein n=1 Tax=Phreatobacter aquaticus TaxID=2570229 RepID=A0A4D7QKH1_9HYPH|nr:ABC transporter substrate-binding protein [Phreatobacter aquaticus]QCK86189.1 ABC transporter substrate-binding protein [Phreatobacter aquaticus]
MSARRTSLLAAALVGAVACAAPALAQQQTSITVVREVDSDRYDPHRSTARAASEVLFMLADTLVSLDHDMTSIKPGLAESWTVSPDGKTYTFKLRQDVQFCDGKKMTADDVVYSIKRWIDPATRSPVSWRAGPVEDIVAKDAYTVEYRLKAPFSELLYQLTQSFAVVIDKANVDALGADFGVRGFNGTGPYCWGEWRPRNDMRMRRHDAYRWGPPIYENRGPAHIQEVIWRIVPEENTRLAAVLTGQSQVTQYIPYSGLAQIRANRNLRVVENAAAFWTYFIGFKVDKAGVDDPAVRRAIVMAVDQEAISRDLNFGETEPAYSYIHQAATDWNKAVDPMLIRTNVAEANRILDAAGWVRGADGFRAKNGVRLSPLVYGFTGSTWQKLMETVQGDLRKIGVDLRIQLFDATVAWGKLATQEFDLFGMSFPYITAGDALNLYFRSANAPTPNRMNWKDAATDRLLQAGMTASSDSERAVAYGEVLRQVHEAAVWIPLYHEPMKIAASNRLAAFKAHNIYGCGLYKGLDLRFIR